MKFDPFGTAWRRRSATDAEMDHAEAPGRGGARGRRPGGEIMIEVHGRLSGEVAVEMGRRLDRIGRRGTRNPLRPTSLDLLKEVKAAIAVSASPPANGSTCWRSLLG